MHFENMLDKLKNELYLILLPRFVVNSVKYLQMLNLRRNLFYHIDKLVSSHQFVVAAHHKHHGSSDILDMLAWVDIIKRYSQPVFYASIYYPQNTPNHPKRHKFIPASHQILHRPFQPII